MDTSSATRNSLYNLPTVADHNLFWGVGFGTIRKYSSIGVVYAVHSNSFLSFFEDNENLLACAPAQKLYSTPPAETIAKRSLFGGVEFGPSRLMKLDV